MKIDLYVLLKSQIIHGVTMINYHFEYFQGDSYVRQTGFLCQLLLYFLLFCS